MPGCRCSLTEPPKGCGEDLGDYEDYEDLDEEPGPPSIFRGGEAVKKAHEVTSEQP